MSVGLDECACRAAYWQALDADMAVDIVIENNYMYVGADGCCALLREGGVYA